MGGLVRTVVIIDSEIHKVNAWTNLIPNFIKNKKFIDCNREHIQEFINQETWCSGGDAYFAPEDYGLIVFDFDNKRIIEDQNYCSLNTFSWWEVSLNLYEDENYHEIARWLWDNGFIKVVCRPIYEYQDESDYILLYSKDEINITYDEACQFMSVFRKKRDIKTPHHRIQEFEIDWNKMGWKYKSFWSQDTQTATEFMSFIASYYELNEDDKEHWKKFVDRYED